MEQEKLLEVQDLCKTYDGFFLDNINFNLKRGGIVGLIGPNGAGKSTTMKLILKIIFPESGNLTFKGKRTTDCNVKLFKEKIGYVGENMDFFSKCKLRKIKSFYKSFYPDWDESYYKKMLDILQLNDQYKMLELSKGMKVKFSLCLALSHNPELLLMDEPTSGLDPIIRNEILNILKEYAKDTGASILFSSHITEDMEKIAEELLFMHNGKIICKCLTQKLVEKGIPIDMYLENLINGGGMNDKIIK